MSYVPAFSGLAYVCMYVRVCVCVCVCVRMYVYVCVRARKDCMLQVHGLFLDVNSYI